MERTREKSRCCGAGGGLKTLDRDLVGKIADKRIDDACMTGASIIVTSCPFCEQTLSEATKAKGDKVKVLDITELIVRFLV
jgi:Fe-S oxidoreductase